MTSSQAETYFQKVIVDYNKGDIEELLGSGSKRAGPLLACVMNGIDAMGGMLCDFERGNSEARSVLFMTQHMNLSKDAAELLYKAVRCGLAHEAIGARGVEFHAENEASSAGPIMCEAGNGNIRIDARALAREFMRAVDKLNANTASLKYAPPPYATTLIATVRKSLQPCGRELSAEHRSSIPQDFGTDS